MRYIDNRNNEPNFLTKYRDSTPGATYSCARIDKENIRSSLLEEQGYICAYCMCKIDLSSSTIEHYVSQEKHPNSSLPESEHRRLSLVYSNMSAVCINNGEHCDKSRGNVPFKILDPHNALCEKLITYNLSGEVVPTGIHKEKVTFDRDLLHLNVDKLCKFRRTVWEDIWKRFVELHADGITREMLLEEAALYRTKICKRGKLKFHAYCNYIAWAFGYYAENYQSLVSSTGGLTNDKNKVL